MATPKSPFFVVGDFLSPKVCESLIDNLTFFTPDVDRHGDPIMMSRSNERNEQVIFSHFEQLIPTLEQYYGFDHKGTELMQFEYYAEGVESQFQCGSSSWVKKKWVRTKDRDFTCLLFLSDYQDQVPFDHDYEVYGGKIEFPQWNFSFNPNRGTLVVFPAGPHFVHVVSPIIAGDMFLTRFHLAGKLPYMFDPKQFPGTYRDWFK